jgi:hypothetical protein
LSGYSNTGLEMAAEVSRAEIAQEGGECSQVASWVIRGDVSAACNVVLLGVIGDKARATWGRTLERIVRGGGIIVLENGVVSECGLLRVANGTDLGWCSHHGDGGGEGKEKRE